MAVQCTLQCSEYVCVSVCVAVCGTGIFIGINDGGTFDGCVCAEQQPQPRQAQQQFLVQSFFSTKLLLYKKQKLFDAKMFFLSMS